MTMAGDWARTSKFDALAEQDLALVTGGFKYDHNYASKNVEDQRFTGAEAWNAFATAAGVPGAQMN